MPPTFGWLLYKGDGSFEELLQAGVSNQRLQDEEFCFSHFLTSEPSLRQLSIELFHKVGSQGRAPLRLVHAQRELVVKSFSLSHPHTGRQMGTLLVLFVEETARWRSFDLQDCAALLNGPIRTVIEECQDHSRVNQKTRKVLRLAALGFCTHEISKALYLTNRGVEYHLDIAKKHLRASNRPNTIFLAREYGWI